MPKSPGKRPGRDHPDAVPGADPTAAPAAAHDAGGDGVPVRLKRPARQQFTSSILLLEAFLILFATLVAYGLRVADPAQVWTAGGVLFVVLVLLSRLVGQPGGYVAGTVVQLPVIATGFVVPAMFAMGGIFLVLWLVALRLGRRIDRERAEYDAAHG